MTNGHNPRESVGKGTGQNKRRWRDCKSQGVVADSQETDSSRLNRIDIHVNLLETDRLKLDKIPAWRRAGRHKVPPLCKKLFASDTSKKGENQFSPIDLSIRSNWPRKNRLHVREVERWVVRKIEERREREERENEIG